MIPVTRTSMPPLDEYTAQIKRVWETGWLTNHGALHNELESRLQAYLRSPPLRLLSNGTIAIQIALRALEAKGEIITTPFTFSATTNAIVWEGMTPVFADVDPETYTIDPADVERKITDKTTAILAVHVYGNPCDVHALQDIADRHGLKIIYDAAHAFGVEVDGRSVLEYGDASTLSFHATKLFHTIEGGALISRHDEVVRRTALARNNGIQNELQVVLPGTNAKMNEFQSAMGLCNLPYVDGWLEARERVYARYKAGLDGSVAFQRLVASRYNHAYAPIVLASPEARERVHDALVAEDVKSRRYFYPLTSDFDYFPAGTTQRANVPVAQSVATRVLCLPMFPDLADADIDRIVEVVRRNA